MADTPIEASREDIDQSTSRRELGGMSSLVLAAYLSTGLRDFFVVARSSENSLLDPAVLALSAGSTVAAFVGLVLVLHYGSGVSIRYLPWVFSVFLVSAVIYPMAPFVGFAGLIGASLVVFHVSQTRAAARGKLIHVTIGNFVSSIFTILFWLIFGLGEVHPLLIGYLLGPVTQTAVATWCGRGVGQVARGRSMPFHRWKIVALAGVTQVTPFVARLAFLGQPTGEVAIASFVLTAVISVAVILASPSATLRLAGRPSPSLASVVRLSWKFTGVAMTGMFIFIVLGNGRLEFIPEEIFQIVRHGFFVVPAMPAVTYLYLRVRSRGDGSSVSRLLTVVSVSLGLQIAMSPLFAIFPSGRGFQWLPFTLSQNFAMVLDKRRRFFSNRTPERE